MPRPAYLVAALALLPLCGCLKSTTEARLAADGSGTVSYDTAYNLEAVAQARQRLEETRQRMEEMGRDVDLGPAEERLESFLAGFDAGRIGESLKARGMRVTKSEAYEEGGWKGVRVTATFSDVNEVLRLARAEREARAAREREAAGAESGEGEGGRRRGGRFLVGRMASSLDTDPVPPFVVAFQATETPGLGRAVLLAPRPARPEGARGGEGAGRRGGRGGMGGGAMPGIEDYRRTLKITFPGPVADVSRCQKEGENTVVLTVRGTDLQPDEDGNVPGLVTDGAHATFRIPEGCSIRFEEPAAAKKPLPEDKKPEGEEGQEPRRRRGDLRGG
jgi:hypothetical protein